MQSLIHDAVELLSKDGYSITILSMPKFEQIYDDSDAPMPDDVHIRPFSFNETALILHSSGTSAFPKPIRTTNKTFVNFGVNLCKLVAFTCLNIHAADTH
jgi:acyl-coenzyme A synthetase/AMP-(fatty) acid ligase